MPAEWTVTYPLTSLQWTVTHWYYNALTGNDDALGTSSGAALRTIAELWRRTFGANVQTDVTVTVAGGADAMTASEAALLDALISCSPQRQWTVD